MNEQLLTLQDFENILELRSSTIRIYLHSYKFTKFERNKKINNRKTIVYLFNQEFYETFLEYLWQKRNLKAIKKLQAYYKSLE